MLADALFSLRKHSEAAVHFGELSRQAPRNPHVWSGLGMSYEALAQGTFDQLARIAPGSARWLALVAESRIRHKQNSSAFYFYRQALAKEPRMRGVHAALAAIYRDTGHSEWAQTEEKKEQVLPPPDCGTAVAECRFRSGDFGGVVAATKQATTPEALYWRTKGYNAMAAEAFRNLVSLGPSVPLHKFQAEQYRNQGRHQDALKELEMALALQPDDRSLRQDFAITLYAARDYAGAEKHLRELLERQTDTADLQFLLGDTLLQLQRPDEAIPFLKSVLQRDPKHLPARAVLGRALLQTGDAAAAVPHLQAALAIDDDGSTHYQLMRAAQTAGNVKVAADAKAKYERIQKLNEAAKKELEEQASVTAPEPP
jgi:predicted Zn-dependent protease